MATTERDYERLGVKRLSLPDVIAQSVGFMGPVFSSAFVIPLVIGVISASGKGGGVASPLSVLVLALVSILVVTGFFIFVIVKLGPANSGKPFDPSSSADGWSGIFFGVLYGVLLFVGFETAANLAEETPNPRREIPIAVMTTAGIATAFYVIATYVEVAGFHYSLKTILAASGAPLFALGAPASAGGYGGTWIDRLLELVVLFDMIAVSIGCAVSASRGIFAMARDRRVPAVFAKTSARHGSPIGAGAFIIAAAIVTLLVNQFWTGLFALPKTPHYFALFAWGSTFGGFALVVVYLLMSVGAIRTFRRGRVIVPAVIGILITAGAIFGSFYKVTSPTIWAPWLALALLAAGFVSTWVLRPRTAATTRLEDLTSKTPV